MEFMIFHLARLIVWFRPFVAPLCFVLIWSFILIAVWQFYSTIRAGVRQVRQLHQIPCANCQFFTGEYNLKCPVNPMNALSEAAIGCRDYFPSTRSYSTVQE